MHLFFVNISTINLEICSSFNPNSNWPTHDFSEGFFFNQPVRLVSMIFPVSFHLQTEFSHLKTYQLFFGIPPRLWKPPHARILSGWWFGTFSIFPYIGNSHPNWLIFFRGVQTTKQLWFFPWLSHWTPGTSPKLFLFDSLRANEARRDRSACISTRGPISESRSEKLTAVICFQSWG